MTDPGSALHQMLTDTPGTDELYRPAEFWRTDLQRLAEEVSGEDLARFRSLDRPLSYFVPTYGFPRYYASVGSSMNLSHPDRLGARYVLLCNLREGKAKAKSAKDVAVRDPVLGEMYDSFLARYRLLATNTVLFGYFTVDCFHSELRLYERCVDVSSKEMEPA